MKILSARNGGAGLALVLAALVGCGDDGGNSNPADAPTGGTPDAPNGGTPDAPNGGTPDAIPGPDYDANPGAYACLGDPLPVTAADPISVTGDVTTVSIGGTAPVSGASITAYDAVDAVLATDTSGGDGSYSMSLVTGGTPLAGYIKATAATYMDTYLYPPTPLTADLNPAPLFTVTPSNFSLIGGLVGDTQAAGKGWIGVAVVDCTGAAILGAVVTTNPAGTSVHYNDGGFPSSTATETGDDGVAYIFNVPDGDVEVSATIDGMTLRAHTIMVREDVITMTAIVP